jgi:hypothetical protein
MWHSWGKQNGNKAYQPTHTITASLIVTVEKTLKRISAYNEWLKSYDYQPNQICPLCAQGRAANLLTRGQHRQATFCFDLLNNLK